MLQAVIQTGGKQYQVSQGDKLIVEKMDGEPGTDITFEQILLISGEQILIGSPYVQGAKVLATILGQDKAKKVIVYKYKRRKGYHKKQGHRQLQTQVLIKEILS